MKTHTTTSRSEASSACSESSPRASKGTLPELLEQLLDAWALIKEQMASIEDSEFKHVLDKRQNALRK
jgi:DNA polymerase elongation subunit (family B)